MGASGVKGRKVRDDGMRAAAAELRQIGVLNLQRQGCVPSPMAAHDRAEDLRVTLLTLVCSFWWMEHVRRSASHVVKRKLREHLMESGLYPPGGRQSGMEWCVGCQRPTPMYDGEGAARMKVDGRWGRICVDCYYGRPTKERVAYTPSAHRFTWMASGDETAHLKGMRRIKPGKSFFETGTEARRHEGTEEQVDDGPQFVPTMLPRFQPPRLRGLAGRPLFEAEDPNAVGGRIDDEGTMHDPRLGAFPSMLPPLEVEPGKAA